MNIKQTELTESFKNFLPGDDEQKLQYIDEVWDMIQKSYASIGGIKGSGFRSKEDMLKNIPMWKLYFSGGKLTVVVLYKDKTGRKLVAIGATSEPGLRKKAVYILGQIMKAGVENSIAEISGGPFVVFARSVNFDVIKPFIFTPKEAEKALGKPVTPAKDAVDKLNVDDLKLYTKFSDYRDFFYLRELGGSLHMKLGVGTPGLRLK